MTDNGVFYLREFRANEFVTPEERERGGVMAEQQHALAGSKCGEAGPNFIEVLVAEVLPLGFLLSKHVRAKHGQCDEC